MVELQEWHTFDFSIEAWAGLLDEIGADEDSQQALFLLAQLGPDGMYATNSIISKIIKKRSEQEWVRSWSAYIQSCARNARHEIGDRRDCGGHMHRS